MALRRTTAMAEDVIVLLDFIGWKDARSINVIGISLGGMIAQGEKHVPVVNAGPNVIIIKSIRAGPSNTGTNSKSDTLRNNRSWWL
jgi:hypothetical protein